MKKTLKEKVDYSINLLQRGEALALKMDAEHGYYLAFSGGKDSQVVLELAKMAGVKYTAIHNVTTNDDADTIRFIKRFYSEVIMDIPKKSFFKLIEQKGLPTRLRRWCCEYYKETKGTGRVVLTGVRAEESAKRAAYAEAARMTKRKHTRYAINVDEMKERDFACVHGRDKFTIRPILYWTSDDVWSFLKEKGCPINPCYEKSRRVGCVFCPMAPRREIEKYMEEHPKQTKAFLGAIQRYLNRIDGGGGYENAEDCLQWWLSRKSTKEYFEQKKQKSMDFE